MSRDVTLVIHGTFARDAAWWRLGGEGERTFADRLESELARRGRAGTVWRPALDAGLDYDAFAWSGRNRHRDRIRAAHSLSAAVNRLADRVAATPEAPLAVSVVAHSHGGNVVLEALRRLAPNARVARIALLGTPLITAQPAFRLARLVFSTVLLALLFVGLIVLVAQLGALLFTGAFLDVPPELGEDGQPEGTATGGGYIAALLIPLLLAYGWLFWLFGNVFDLVWRLLNRLLQPLAWLRGKAGRLVYGPSPRKLATLLDAPPILLLTSRNDEAELMLAIGAAPARLYREYVAAELSGAGRLFELLLLRPFVIGAFVNAIEALLEKVALGFSMWRTLVLDAGVAPSAEPPYYPSELLVRQQLDLLPSTDREAEGGEAEPPRLAAMPDTAAPQPALHLSLREVGDEIKRQIRLRHSAYYENRAVIRHLAAFLAGGPVAAVEPPPPPPPSARPPGAFWETLLVANLASAALWSWVAGERLLSLATLGIALVIYLAPFTVLGIAVVGYGALRRRLPARLWRIFWIGWAASVLLLLLTGVASRLGAQ